MNDAATWIAFASLQFVIFSTIIGGVIKVQRHINTKDEKQTAALIQLNNTMLSAIQNSEQRLEARYTQDSKETERELQALERALQSFRLEVEKEFLSKDSFRIVMDETAKSRLEMKADILSAINELRKIVGDLQTAVGKMGQVQ
jgi:hypothetical protein